MTKRNPKRILEEEYEKFRDYLNRVDTNEIKLSMKEIEQIIGCEYLCDSAYNHEVWWSGKSHPLSKIWLEEGFKKKELNLGSSIVLVKNQVDIAKASEKVGLIKNQVNSVRILEEIGFEKIGNWVVEDKDLKYNILSLYLDKNELLYSFVVNGEIKYIGKTVNSLKKRMYQYQNPGPSQSTNIKNNKNILNSLEKNENVDIYIFKEDEPVFYNGIKINLAAGLEDPLIKKFNPEWNKMGK